MDAFNEVMNTLMTYSVRMYTCISREEEEKAMVLEVFELCHQ